MINRISFLLVMAMIAGACATGRNFSNSGGIVSPLSANASLTDGSLIYGLPLTVIDVEIEAEHVIEKPGPYSKYASDLLGLTDVIRSESENWTITGVNIGTHQELDPEQLYVIEAQGMFLSNVLELKRSGLILDISPDIYNCNSGRISDAETDFSKLKSFDLGSDEYFRNRKDTLFRVINVDTAFIRIPYLVEKKQKLTLDQLAEKAAVRLMELRDGKHLILTGETNIFPQSDAALNEINRLEKEYTELFTGKTFKEKKTFRYQLVPKKEMTGSPTVLCRFSETSGPVTSADKNGKPVVVEFVPELKTAGLKVNYARSVSKSSGTTDKLFYRVPDIVNIRISFGNEALNMSRKLIYQFGEVIRMPQNYILGK
ncbi:MAG TPA: DUF4831 family protein [Bacteroidales bacterium]|jgi:hypothetical protein|nr:DUF4831 family protein [Bacteroidales bacterium]